MGQTTIKMRHELKYYINDFEYFILKSRISHVLKKDAFSCGNDGYHIRSLYFDSIYNSSLFDKISGVERRDKFRFRIYNMDDGIIKLEKKTKIGSLTAKQVTLINKYEAQKIMEGDIQPFVNSRDVLIRNFYLESRNNRLKPVVIVDYKREAYVHPAGNVRVTFDRELKTGLNSVDFFNRNVPVICALDEPLTILEIKYDEFIPSYIIELINTVSKPVSSISKYAICRKYNKIENWEDN